MTNTEIKVGDLVAPSCDGVVDKALCGLVVDGPFEVGRPFLLFGVRWLNGPQRGERKVCNHRFLALLSDLERVSR